MVEIDWRWEKMMKGREKRYSSMEKNEDSGRIYEDKWNNLWFSRIKRTTLSMEKAYRRIPHQNLHTNPVLVPILGRVVFDSLRRRSSLVLLLQNKLGLPMMPSLGLSFSPLPGGDLVSRESQKTKRIWSGGGELKELGLPPNPTDEIDFRELQASDGKFNRADGKSMVRLAYRQNFTPIGRLDHEISTFLFRAFLAIDRMTSSVSSSPSSSSRDRATRSSRRPLDFRHVTW